MNTMTWDYWVCLYTQARYADRGLCDPAYLEHLRTDHNNR
jgi:hypothetical protein